MNKITFNKLSLREVTKILIESLFPLCRSLSGTGNDDSFNIIKSYLPTIKKQKIRSGEKVFDWTIPPEWNVKNAYVKNYKGEKIIDFKKSNIQLVSYSKPFNGYLNETELIPHIHTIESKPEWIPYRTTYYKDEWGFCAPHKLLSSNKFKGPFEILIDSEFKKDGNLAYFTDFHAGTSKKTILISSYCCHPSLANDNLSGIVTSILLFKYIKSLETHYSYKLFMGPETIGSIAFLAKEDFTKIIGGTIVTCTAGPDKASIKESFNKNNWLNKLTHLVLREKYGKEYITYPFEPNGSDERQYSSPGIKINTPSIHKSKYYEYEEYHTSADNLSFISVDNLLETFDTYKKWFHAIENLCFPKRYMPFCEYQLGKRNLYPSVGGAYNQKIVSDFEIDDFTKKQIKNYSNENKIKAIEWVMHLSDGDHSNIDISESSNLDLSLINQTIKKLSNVKLIENKKFL